MTQKPGATRNQRYNSVQRRHRELELVENECIDQTLTAHKVSCPLSYLYSSWECTNKQKTTKQQTTHSTQPIFLPSQPYELTDQVAFASHTARKLVSPMVPWARSPLRQLKITGVRKLKVVRLTLLTGDKSTPAAGTGIVGGHAIPTCKMQRIKEVDKSVPQKKFPDFFAETFNPPTNW